MFCSVSLIISTKIIKICETKSAKETLFINAALGDGEEDEEIPLLAVEATSILLGGHWS